MRLQQKRKWRLWKASQWTSVEIAALKSGVGKHGKGNWKDILNDSEFAVLRIAQTSI